MATPRLPFLWPFLYASTRSRLARTNSRPMQRHLQTSAKRKEATVTQRYGTANEPLIPSSKPKSANESGRNDGTVIDVKALSKPSPKVRKDKTQSQQKNATTTEATEPDAKVQKKPSPVQTAPKIQSSSATLGVARTEQPPTDTCSSSSPSSSKRPPDTVLDMPSSDSLEMATIPSYYERDSSVKGDDHRPPHIATPPHVHHFDTYSLVNDLQAGGWTHEQSVTIMKAVRLILVENMKLASEGLVSKSNVENETYLFRAACSELKTEINTKRKAETEKSGTQRTQIQHEVDILGQKLNQEGAVLKDELKGMFDDRKMAVRNEQRSMESKIQELNYRITVALNSDSRSDVEGVRWIITKRAITALAICVLMVLSSLKYSSMTMQAQEEERKRFADMSAASVAPSSSLSSSLSSGGHVHGNSSGSGGRGSSDSSAGGDGGIRREDAPGDGRERRVYGVGEVLVKEGDNPSFVSLG